MSGAERLVIPPRIAAAKAPWDDMIGVGGPRRPAFLGTLAAIRLLAQHRAANAIMGDTIAALGARAEWAPSVGAFRLSAHATPGGTSPTMPAKSTMGTPKACARRCA